MASGSNPALDDDELKGDGKKRKFKPLEAMRKFFGKGKRKAKDESVSVVAVKAKSTTALHHDDDQDDDDGGFKTHQPRPLGGNRSISEDSVFSPEQREPNLERLKKAAVSEESLPRSAFQAELLTKLNKRRSQYSDEDDGLPHSPTPPVTTADIIMGGPLKPLPAAGKSTSRESDNSLVSMDNSENEEDDPFKSQWKSSVPSKVSLSQSKSGGGSEAPIDFDNMSHTELLKSDIAKDRISIKPRARKANRQSRKKREGQSPHSLPSLNEETSPKSRAHSTPSTSVSDPQGSTADTQDKAASPSKPAPDSVMDRSSSATPRHQQLTKQSSDSSPAPHKPTPTPSPTPHKLTSTPSPTSPKPISTLSPTPHKPTPTPSPTKSVAAVEPFKSDAVKTDMVKPDAVKQDAVKQETVKPDVKEGTVKEDWTKMEAGRFSVKSSTPAGLKDDNAGKVSFDSRKAETVTIAGSRTQTSKLADSAKKDSPDLSPSTSAASREPGGSLMSRSMPSVTFTSKSDSTTEAMSQSTKSRTDFLTSSVRSSSSDSSSLLMTRSAEHNLPPTSSIQKTDASTPVTTATTAVSVSSSLTHKSSSAPSSSPKDGKKAGLRQTDVRTSAAFSPKEDYKLRRELRSKTLPEQPVNKEEAFATKVQRAASHRVETSSQNASPEASPRFREKAGEAPKSQEPEWFALVKKRAVRQESDEKKDQPSPTKETTATKDPVASAPAPEVSPADAPAAKAEPVSKLVETSSNMSVSSASSRFERFSENKQSEVTRTRGGSVKTSPSKTSAFAQRGSSVKVLSTKSDATSVGSVSSVTPSSLKTTSVSTAPAGSTAPVVKQEEKKEEVKSCESSPARDVPKWKTQSVKTPAFSSGSPSAVSASRFGSVKTPSQSSPAPQSSTSTKPDPKPVSPVKRAPLTKSSSEEDKPSVPAWRANLSQKKSGSSDLKIELIESASGGSSSSAAAGSKKEETTKKQESPTKTPAASKDVQSDQCRTSAAPSRSSKVMNLLKNFENVQGVS